VLLHPQAFGACVGRDILDRPAVPDDHAVEDVPPHEPP
jgi:hypothetical protein